MFVKAVQAEREESFDLGAEVLSLSSEFLSAYRSLKIGADDVAGPEELAFADRVFVSH